MQTASAADTGTRYGACAHCGLPVALPGRSAPSRDEPCPPPEIFCCHACRLVALITGRQEQGEQALGLVRLGFGALIAMNVMMISLLLYSGSVEPEAVPRFRLVLLLLATPALAILLPPFVTAAARQTAAGKAGLDLLIATGSLSAFAVSAVNVLSGTGEIYFDTGTMLPVLVTAGKLAETSAKKKAGDLLHALESLLPDKALLVTPDGSREVEVGSLRPGDRVRVRPGERIAVDGRVVDGVSGVEEAPFSGEFLPRTCRPGDRVLAGTVNGTGTLLVEAESTGTELLLHGIGEMVRQAWQNPSGAERLAEKAASLFLAAVLFLAAAALLFWTLSGDPGRALLSTLSVLVVACPCTMGIATPLATSLAIARAAREGIVVRGGGVIELLARLDTACFDKTGTLTCGNPVLTDLELLDPCSSREELLGRLAALEAAGGHPLGRAIVAKARESGVRQGEAIGVEVSPGSGIRGTVIWEGKAKEVRAGTLRFAARGEPAPEPDKDGSLVYVAWQGKLRARLTFADALRPDAAESVLSLSRQGIACILLSGDRLATAAAAGRGAGIDRVEAPCTPKAKGEFVSGAIAAGRTVAMVGDGVNDAPALAAAHAGVALGCGMELARQAGNVVILSGRLSQLPWLVALSRRTAAVIRGNFAWSFAYNAVALAAAAAGLLHPLLAALAMVVSSLTVLGNSLRVAAFPEAAPLTCRPSKDAPCPSHLSGPS